MAKIVYLISRKGSSLPFNSIDMEQILSRLSPDNIVPAAPRIIEDEGILIGIFNPVNSFPVKAVSVCLGAFFDKLENWWQPGTKIPDGNFALFRSDGRILEVITDIVASRTIWYIRTPDLFIASTSQRAIICFLQSYEPNEAAIPWMLSSGTLGPGFGWDRRIHCLGGDSCLKLDRQSWKMETLRQPVVYSPLKLPVQEHEHRLLASMEKTFEYIDPHDAKWVLPLSGGYDSRAILLMLKNRSGLKTVTWGLQAALGNRQSDAWVARELAKRTGVENKYFETDLPNEPVERILKRFLIAGEGRIDHVSGYMDGFAVWKWLYEQGYQGILRGDEAFGCRAVTNNHQVYKNMNLIILSDFSDTNPLGSILNLKDQKRPDHYEKKNSETLEQWRDRINTEFEIPFLFAALSDLKLSYVEIIQPLLSRRIVEQVRLLPDKLRTEKYLFKKIISRMPPGLKFAKYPAIESRADIVRDKAVVDVICKKLQQVNGKPDGLAPLASYCLDQLNREKTKPIKVRCRKTHEKIIRLVKKISGSNKNQSLKTDPYNLCFRVFIISEMIDIFHKDAGVLKRQNL